MLSVLKVRAYALLLARFCSIYLQTSRKIIGFFKKISIVIRLTCWRCSAISGPLNTGS